MQRISANGTSFASHKVVQIPEIVELILSFLDKSSNVQNALVCKQWSDIALNLLWRDLPDVCPLFELLCPMKLGYNYSEYKHIFTRRLGSQDWDRFARYARRVRSLTKSKHTDASGRTSAHFKTPSASAFDEVARSRPSSSHLLPHLRALAWLAESDTEMRYSIMFMHERIVDFTVQLHDSRDYPVAMYLKEVALRMPNITHIDLRYGDTTDIEESDVVELLRDLPKLKRVIFPLYSLTSKVISQLSQHPDLGVVQFEFNLSQGAADVEGVLHFAPELQEGAFPALWDISLSARLSDITAFLNDINGPANLTLLYVHVLTPTTPDEITQFLNVVVENCQCLTNLYLDYMSSSIIVEEPETPPARITWETLRPLLSIPNLVVFEMRWDLPIQITQQEVEEIAMKWPSLEGFLLNCEPVNSSEESTLTLEALLPFARHCPELRELGLYLNASRATDEDAAALGPLVKPFKKLQQLSVGLSSISDPGPVALYLSHLCPADCELSSGVTWPDGFGMVQNNSNAGMLDLLNAQAAVWWEKWAEVEKVLPLLTKLRIQEREARAALEKEVADLRTRCRLLLSERSSVQIRPDDSCIAV
ncbi:hypothetical protein BXZ70DRAFT_469086 [Cristinia sonorae]|uniref:F-box domain-containing protein n=1 Tax=Cristinia sonorae TaxID=1940300 RepID=A0A8K0UHC8_9AGAR|nr:hypothetical protein BXZ70DRAFT_469086 [Cristinia sonorae]